MLTAQPIPGTVPLGTVPLGTLLVLAVSKGQSPRGQSRYKLKDWLC
jgi:hypothetical protein